MGQKKLYRFNQIKSFENVLEYPLNMRGNWNRFFKNNNPIYLELACGRGEYTTGLAALHAHKNFIGIDIKGNRMYIGAKKAIDEKLTNAAFLRTQIEKLTDYFNEGEISGIWITFPDPQLRVSKAKKRLTHPRFLQLYKQILNDSGSIHLKTDSPQLFGFTKEITELYSLPVAHESDDIYAYETVPPELNIKTHYEKLDIAKSNKIHYLEFKIPFQLPIKDNELKELIDNERRI